uniref:Uncharacterized protein n=1 Tax=Sphaerodactylus townsendi TaxID=933632 RepID=A0ACB8ENS8_9SAUR
MEKPAQAPEHLCTPTTASLFDKVSSVMCLEASRPPLSCQPQVLCPLLGSCQRRQLLQSHGREPRIPARWQSCNKLRVHTLSRKVLGPKFLLPEHSLSLPPVQSLLDSRHRGFSSRPSSRWPLLSTHQHWPLFCPLDARHCKMGRQETGDEWNMSPPPFGLAAKTAFSVIWATEKQVATPFRNQSSGKTIEFFTSVSDRERSGQKAK